MTIRSKRAPYLFDEFFASGKEESVSPFLSESGKKWGHNLSLKISVLSALFLLVAFLCKIYFPPLSPVFLLFVYVFSGTPALIHTVEDCKNLEINIDVLMTAAALLSVLIGSGFEGALLLVLFELSASIEMAVTEKTKSTLAGLHKIAPGFAYVLDKDGYPVETSIRDIEPGIRILIKAGEIVPLDGNVVEGSSFVTLGHITGESAPVSKSIGDEVLSGSYNLDGTLTVVVTRKGQDSALAKIIDLITQAQESKPRLQTWIDAFDKKYATTIIVLTGIFAASLPFFIPSLPYLGPEGSVYRALTFLIAASPCALVIGAPTAYLAAIGSCAKRGIVLKGGSVLDSLARCKRIAFDKTGTLTTGKPICYAIRPLNQAATGVSVDTALTIAGSLERHIKHPIAQALVDLVQEKNLSFIEIDHMKSTPGFGVTGIDPRSSTPCRLGSRSFLSLAGIDIPQEEEEIGATQTYLLLGEAVFGFYFLDEIRPGVEKLLSELRQDRNMSVLMLTGDDTRNASKIAEKLGIEEFFAELKPEDKLEKVSSLAGSEGLVMIGDGVNDAPALAAATVGISMGKIGSGSAVAASDVVFLHDNIECLNTTLQKSRQTVRIIKQNITLALSVILLATTPALAGWVPLWLAVILHEGGTVLVGLNSLRLLRK